MISIKDSFDDYTLDLLTRLLEEINAWEDNYSKSTPWEKMMMWKEKRRVSNLRASLYQVFSIVSALHSKPRKKMILNEGK